MLRTTFQGAYATRNHAPYGALAVSASQIKTYTNRDPLLSEVKQLVQQGWPARMEGKPGDMQPYERRKDELSLQNGCLLWGGRVVFPHNYVIAWLTNYTNLIQES